MLKVGLDDKRQGELAPRNIPGRVVQTRVYPVSPHPAHAPSLKDGVYSSLMTMSVGKFCMHGASAHLEKQEDGVVSSELQ